MKDVSFYVNQLSVSSFNICIVYLALAFCQIHIPLVERERDSVWRKEISRSVPFDAWRNSVSPTSLRLQQGDSYICCIRGDLRRWTETCCTKGCISTYCKFCYYHSVHIINGIRDMLLLILAVFMKAFLDFWFLFRFILRASRALLASSGVWLWKTVSKGHAKDYMINVGLHLRWVLMEPWKVNFVFWKEEKK